jgi:hypothetical protein
MSGTRGTGVGSRGLAVLLIRVDDVLRSFNRVYEMLSPPGGNAVRPGGDCVEKSIKVGQEIRSLSGDSGLATL